MLKKVSNNLSKSALNTSFHGFHFPSIAHTSPFNSEYIPLQDSSTFLFKSNTFLIPPQEQYIPLQDSSTFPIMANNRVYIRVSRANNRASRTTAPTPRKVSTKVKKAAANNKKNHSQKRGKQKNVNSVENPPEEIDFEIECPICFEKIHTPSEKEIDENQSARFTFFTDGREIVV